LLRQEQTLNEWRFTRQLRKQLSLVLVQGGGVVTGWAPKPSFPSTKGPFH
jgi:hypothetical protein